MATNTTKNKNDNNIPEENITTYKNKTIASQTPSKPDEIRVEGMVLEKMHIHLEGTSPLITHRWSEKAKKMMLDKQMGKGTQKKEAKDPYKDFIETIYFIDKVVNKDGSIDLDKSLYGFPQVGFKAAVASAFNFVGGGIKKTVIRGAFHIVDGIPTEDGMMAPIFAHVRPVMKESMVKIAMGTTDIRHRAEFPKWSTVLTCQFNKRVITPSELINLFEAAGFSVGIGEWRPEKDGDNGMFRVKTEAMETK